MILPKVRDPRFITVRRGGSLPDDDHHLLAMWAADCAEHVLHLFEQARPERRPTATRDRARACVGAGRGHVVEARTAAGHANAAARDLSGAARHAAYAAGQAAAVGHVAAHELGAAAYAIRAARAAAPEDEATRPAAGVPVAARAAPRRDPGSGARRPAAAQRAVLVRVSTAKRILGWLVGEAGLEPTISCSQSTCVANYATPRRFLFRKRMCSLNRPAVASLHRSSRIR